MEARDCVVRVGQIEHRFLIDETQGSGELVIFEFTMPPNAKVPAPHYHRDVDELVYGLEGTFTSTRDGIKYEIGPGDSLFIARGCVHNHENLTSQKVRGIAVMNPGTIGRRYFEDIAQVVNVPGGPDLAKVREIMLRHGLCFPDQVHTPGMELAKDANPAASRVS
jgi:quercetin dioxygenase-like cupin family protein